MGRSPALAVNVKPQLAFRILRREIDVAGRRIRTFGDQNELMNQFLHAGQNFFLGRQDDLAVGDIDRLFGRVVGPAGNFVQTLPQNAHALPHFLNSHQITIIAIAH